MTRVQEIINKHEEWIDIYKDLVVNASIGEMADWIVNCLSSGYWDEMKEETHIHNRVQMIKIREMIE
tara:strand:- start:1491 stop:1691 length:201 start_codon:yes stop_codon:yes gene_type:complete